MDKQVIRKGAVSKNLPAKFKSVENVFKQNSNNNDNNNSGDLGAETISKTLQRRLKVEGK